MRMKKPQVCSFRDNKLILELLRENKKGVLINPPPRAAKTRVVVKQGILPHLMQWTEVFLEGWT